MNQSLGYTVGAEPGGLGIYVRENAAVVPSPPGETKRGGNKLADQLVEVGYPAGALQDNLSQNALERVMDDFCCVTILTLVSTNVAARRLDNVAARRLDVEGVWQVINFDLPDSELLFTHRAGRTGRMGRYGEAVTFATPDEERKWR